MPEQEERPGPPSTDEDLGPLGDVGAGLILLAISAVGGWSVLSNPDLVSTDYGADPGPGMMPQFALGLIALFSIALIARAAPPIIRDGWDLALQRARRARWRIGVPTLMIATMFAYALLFPILGFVWTTLGFSVFWTVFMGIAEFRPGGAASAYALYIFEGAIITLLVWLAFAKLIRIPLP